jgi:hypothetical protein
MANRRRHRRREALVGSGRKSLRSWVPGLMSLGSSATGRPADLLGRMLGFERLEQRVLLAADFGDAPLPYPTLLVENGARHEAIGPTLGSARDTEADGVHSAAADADGTDEDGVTFGTIRVGQLGAIATVNVQNAPSGAKLDAWIDFDGDGNWGGPAEQIADSLPVGNGNIILTFDVPSLAADGSTFARFRLSTAGNLGVRGAAADGEVEDYAVTIGAPVASSGVFGDQTTISTSADSVQAVHAADIDGDGDMDVLSANRFDNVIAWYENDGSAGFTAHTISTTVNLASSVFVADVDGDGDVDVLSASQSGGIAWHENDGSPAIGNWNSHTISGGSFEARGIYAGDADGDGDLDVFTAAQQNSTIAWYENDGTPASGEWTARILSSSNNSLGRSIHAVDIDGDGNLDVLSATSEAIVWHRNNGVPASGWGFKLIASSSESVIGFTDVFAGDLDGDGDPDILSTSNLTHSVVWYENDGTPSVGSWTARKIAVIVEGMNDVSTADLDGDGDLDVLATGINIAWYENDGSPTVGDWVMHSLIDVVDGASDVHAADLDGDGDLDVISSSYLDDRVAWYENRNPGVGMVAPPTSVAEEGANSLVYTFYRIGANATATQLTVNFAVSGFAVFGTDYTASGALSFTTTTGAVFFDLGVSEVQVVVTPVDDALLELDEPVVLSLLADPAFVFHGAPSAAGVLTNAEFGGDFGDSPSPYPTSVAENGARHENDGPTLGTLRDAEANGLHSAAADADGADEDGVTFGAVRVSQLGAAVIVNVQNAPSGAKLDAWIDFDGDGNWNGPADQIVHSVNVVNGDNVLLFDVPSGAASGATLARLRLSTTGNLKPIGAAADGEVEDYVVTIEPPTVAAGLFGPQITISTAVNTAQSVFAADLDGDGDQDVLSASQNGKIAWYENDGAEGFTAHTITTSANVAWDVYAADVDGDGDTDVLSASRNDSKIAWYENDGTPAVGDWTAHTITIDAAHARSVYAADLDGDGDLDVLSASSYDDKIAWYENDGAQGFTAHAITTTANGAHSVHAADVDGDGDLDVLSASYDDKIAWYENDGTPSVGAWTARNITTVANGAFEVHAADVDGDGDIDILSASRIDGKVAWYDNDGTPTVGAWTARTINTTYLAFASSVFPADVDGDGDLDVLAAGNNTTVWYENDGTPSVGAWSSHTVGTGAASAYAADVDGDGDLDVLTAVGSKIAWYENVLAGDYDCDLNVDAADYDFWKSHFGESTGPGLAADGNGNGVVDAADYSVWRDNLGNSQSPGAGAGVAGALAEPSVNASQVPASSSDGATLFVGVASSTSLSVPTAGTRTTVSARATDRLFSQWNPRRWDNLLLARIQLSDSVRLRSIPYVTKPGDNEAATDAALGDLEADSVVGHAARRLGKLHASL